MTNRRTPLHPWHAARGARMVPFGGWDMPVQYAGIVAEHTAVRTACGLFDISHMGRLRATGPDAPPFLEGVFTNAVATMKPGQVRYGLVCNEAGGTLDDVLVYRRADGYGVVVNASNREKIAGWFDAHRGAMSVTVADESDATAMIAAQGPTAVALAADLFGVDVAALRYYFAAEGRYCGEPCEVSRTGYTGEDGFEAVVPAALGVPLWDELVGRGAVPCGLGARDTLRLEAAMPLYGHELSETIDPLQAGLSWAVKLDKGPFVGREALREAAANAWSRPTRVGLALDGKRAAREGSPILAADGTKVGAVTSGSFAPTLGRPIAMGYVDPGHTAPGTPLAVDIRGAVTPAAVVELPFYKRPKNPPKPVS